MSMEGISRSEDEQHEETVTSDPLPLPINPLATAMKFTQQRAEIRKQLLTNDNVDNRLHYLEALRQRLMDGKESLTEEDELYLTDAAEKLAQNISSFELQDTKFKEKQDIIQGFLKTIRANISEPILTTSLVIQTMLKLQAQFTEKAEARKNAVILAEKLAFAKEMAAKEKPQLSSSSSSESSSNSQSSGTPLPSSEVFPIAALEKDAQSAKELAEKPTAIPLRYQGLYNGFVQEMLNPGHSKRLDAITYQLQFANIDQELMSDKNSPLKKADMLAASEQWDTIVKGRKARLADIDSKGKAFSGIVKRVNDWNAKMPEALSSEEIKHRETLVSYIPEESENIGKREARLREVSGYKPRREQLAKMAVARDKANAKKRVTDPL
ncbi:MAG TPA: hypothetical protein PLD88_06300, partial [Candidatus Berkiella sp.]|nr:hypothetical protein [Candidatus Berkiella sp.]